MAYRKVTLKVTAKVTALVDEGVSMDEFLEDLDIVHDNIRNATLEDAGITDHEVLDSR